MFVVKLTLAAITDVCEIGGRSIAGLRGKLASYIFLSAVVVFNVAFDIS